MKLRIAFVHYGDDPTTMPNAIVVTDDYMEDEHGGVPPFYLDEVADIQASGETVREAIIVINDADVEALFTMPTIPLTGGVRSVPSGIDADA